MHGHWYFVTPDILAAKVGGGYKFWVSEGKSKHLSGQQVILFVDHLS